MLIFALFCILFLPKTKADVIKSKYFNYVEKGGKTVKTSPSTQFKLMETYPQATVTVYLAGTLTLASLWDDRNGLVIKNNPFVADIDSFYYFYVDCGKYDIKFSGTGVAAPYTYGDIFVCGLIGSGDVDNDGTGTLNYIPKWTSTTTLGDSDLFNISSQVRAGASTYFGWTNGLPSAPLDVAFFRTTTGLLEINSGANADYRDLFLRRITPHPNATIAGLNFGTLAGDPSSVVAGDCWYNTVLNKFRCFENGTVQNIIEPAGSGITSINTLTAVSQFLVTGTAGTDFNIVSLVDTHTFNIPSASLTARGLVTINAQTFNGKKTFNPTVTFSGFNFGVLAGDPATTVDGDCWYNSSLAKYRCTEASANITLDPNPNIPYDVATQIQGIPTASAVVLHFVAVRSFNLPSSFTGTKCDAIVAATAQTDFVVKVNGVTKGTLRFAIAGTTCSIVSGTATSIVAGDIVTITAPASPDATLSDIALVLKGTML